MFDRHHIVSVFLAQVFVVGSIITPSIHRIEHSRSWNHRHGELSNEVLEKKNEGIEHSFLVENGVIRHHQDCPVCITLVYSRSTDHLAETQFPAIDSVRSLNLQVLAGWVSAYASIRAPPFSLL